MEPTVVAIAVEAKTQEAPGSSLRIVSFAYDVCFRWHVLVGIVVRAM